MKLFEQFTHPKRWFTGLSCHLARDLGWSITGVRIGWLVLGIIQPVITLMIYIGLSLLYPDVRSR